MDGETRIILFWTPRPFDRDGLGSLVNQREVCVEEVELGVPHELGLRMVENRKDEAKNCQFTK